MNSDVVAVGAHHPVDAVDKELYSATSGANDFGSNDMDIAIVNALKQHFGADRTNYKCDTSTIFDDSTVDGIIENEHWMRSIAINVTNLHTVVRYFAWKEYAIFSCTTVQVFWQRLARRKERIVISHTIFGCGDNDAVFRSTKTSIPAGENSSLLRRTISSPHPK